MTPAPNTSAEGLREARVTIADLTRQLAEAEEDRTLATDGELDADPHLMVRHLEHQCRDFIRERDEWKAVANMEAASLASAEARAREADARAERLTGALKTIRDEALFGQDYARNRIAVIARTALSPEPGQTADTTHQPQETPMNRTVIAGLLERVRAAEGANKALDREIACSIGGWHRVTHSQHGLGSKRPRFISAQDWVGHPSDGQPILDSLHGTDLHQEVPLLTASVDAALALVERFRGQGIDPTTLMADALDRMTREGFRPAEPLGPQIARAILVEFLTALLATPEPDLIASGDAEGGSR